jgi:outer membrane protein TolC
MEVGMRRLGFSVADYPWRMGVIGMALVLLSSVALSLARQPQEPSHRIAQAASPPSAPPRDNPPPARVDERLLELSLADAVQLAVQNNLDIERERYGPRIAHTDVLREHAAFDPVVGLDASISQTKVLPESRILNFDPTTGEVIGERTLLPFSKDGEVTPLFKQKIITGGNYELRFINTRLNEAPSSSGTRFALEDPRYESSLDLTLTQPLLRDFGIAFNSAPTRRAETAEAVAHQRVLQQILDVVFEVQEGYWNLVFQIEDLAAKRESQKLAEDFLAENKIRVEIGTLAPIELVQAETQVKIREEDVILAESAVQDAEDVLKETLNVPQIMDTWQLRIQPTDQPTFAPLSTLVLEDKIEQAFKERPDIIESQLDIESRQIARQEAENQRMPRLDLQAQGRLGAFGGDAGGSISGLPDARGYEWLFGLQFEYPLGNRAAQNTLQRRQFELQQALVGQRVLRLAIVREIREAVRGIETAIKRVEVTRAATKLAQTQLEAEQEKFR